MQYDDDDNIDHTTKNIHLSLFDNYNTDIDEYIHSGRPFRPSKFRDSVPSIKIETAPAGALSESNCLENCDTTDADGNEPLELVPPLRMSIAILPHELRSATS